MSLATVLFWLGLMLLFLLLNALFVATEYSLVKLRRSRVQDLVNKGYRGARTIQQLQRNLGTSIAGTQLGITLASLALGWIGENTINMAAKFLLGFIPGFANFHVPFGLGYALAFLCLSIFHVTLGEQVPKAWALRLPEKVGLALAKPFQIFCWMAYPLLWLMNTFAAVICKVLGLPAGQADEYTVVSGDEFEILFEASHKAGLLGDKETDLLKRALELKELTARQCMIPRTRMDVVPETFTLAQLLAVVAKTKHSKLPVIRGTRDTVVGIINTRDLFDWWNTSISEGGDGTTCGGKEFKLTEHLRQVYFVPESMPAGRLLEEMRSRKLQMAIIVDEFGATTGLLTLEDLLEQLVGEIWDEYDTAQPGIQANGTDRWNVMGDVTLFEFHKATGITVTCDSCTTMAGAFIEALRRQPVVGDSVEMPGGLKAVVAEMRGQGISRLEIEKLPAPPAPEEPEESTP